jgi:hypothetical protein
LVWLSCHDLQWLAKRHGLAAVAHTVNALAAALNRRYDKSSEITLI